MFKIDWPTAIGGAIIGYYAKGKVESVKSDFKGIYTGAIDTLKESFSSDDSQGTQSTQNTAAQQVTGKKNG